MRVSSTMKQVRSRPSLVGSLAAPPSQSAIGEGRVVRSRGTQPARVHGLLRSPVGYEVGHPIYHSFPPLVVRQKARSQLLFMSIHPMIGVRVHIHSTFRLVLYFRFAMFHFDIDSPNNSFSAKVKAKRLELIKQKRGEWQDRIFLFGQLTWSG